MSKKLREIPDLFQALRALVAQIPAGRVTTYRALAEALGNPIATLWVAKSVLDHLNDPTTPFYRVVPSDGQLSRIAKGDWQARAEQLAAEGVDVRQGTVELADARFTPVANDRPLERLKQVQREVEALVSIPDEIAPAPSVVGGVDVSYPSEEEGVAAYALVETETGKLVWSTTVRCRVGFPYITSYLSFRELPILLTLIDEVRAAGKLAEVVLVDGSGILHHRHAGIASHLGVVANLPTIGVTKTLLVGSVDLEGMAPLEPRPVVLEERPIGVAIRASSRSRRPIFVSPGHQVGLALAEAIVRTVLLGRRIPEPLYWADRLSRLAGKAAT